MSLYLIFSNEIALGRGDCMSWHEDEPMGPKETESASLLCCATIVSFGNGPKRISI